MTPRDQLGFILIHISVLVPALRDMLLSYHHGNRHQIIFIIFLKGEWVLLAQNRSESYNDTDHCADGNLLADEWYLKKTFFIP